MDGERAGQFGLLRQATSAGGSSFSAFLSSAAPDLMPGSYSGSHSGAHPVAHELAPHGTTIAAALFDGGVAMAGDRRATMGNLIAHRDIEKVFAADEYSLVGIAGTAGLAIETCGSDALLSSATIITKPTLTASSFSTRA